ncbi:MAG: hypothetical protein ABDK93_08325, partial [Atribacterota bacterium]
MKSPKIFLFSVILLFLFLGTSLEAQTVVTIDGQRIESKARLVTRNGTVYVAIEDLLKDIGGIAYYSPIMKKANLKYGKFSWVLSLD